MNKRPSIEEKICNMLEKVLDESFAEEEKDRLTALKTNADSSCDSSISEDQQFHRKEKKTKSHVVKKSLFFSFKQAEAPCDETNYEELYDYQRTLMHKQKRFKTTNITSSMLINSASYFPPELKNSCYNSFNNTQRGSLGAYNAPQVELQNSPKYQDINNYQQKLFSFNNTEGGNNNYQMDSCLTNKNDQITPELYEKLTNNFSRIIKTQNGSLILQNCFAKTDKQIVSQIFNEILPELYCLITDCYGNYFCQKFFNFVNAEEKLVFLKELRKNLVQISNNSIGTYPLQSIIEKLATNEEKMIICEAILNETVLKEICSDQHGVHVIEKIIACFKEEMIPFVYEYILRNFITLANTSTGLVVVKKVIIHHSQPKTLKRIQMLITSNFADLIQNAFGNYTIQVALEVKSLLN
jgi:hypothetical protein